MILIKPLLNKIAIGLNRTKEIHLSRSFIDSILSISQIVKMRTITSISCV